MHPGAQRRRRRRTPNCRAINDKVLALARQIRPDIVLLHGTWEKYLDNVAETVAALKKQTSARIVVLGSVPWWKRGLPNEVLRYFMLHHRLIPERSGRAVSSIGPVRSCARNSFRCGAEFISAWDALVQCGRLSDAHRRYRQGYFGERSGAPDRKRIGVPGPVQSSTDCYEHGGPYPSAPIVHRVHDIAGRYLARDD